MFYIYTIVLLYEFANFVNEVTLKGRAKGEWRGTDCCPFESKFKALVVPRLNRNRAR